MCRINVLKWLNPNSVVIMESRMPITNLLWHIMGYIQLNLHPSQKHDHLLPHLTRWCWNLNMDFFLLFLLYLDYPGYFPTHAALHEMIKFSASMLLDKTAAKVCFTKNLKNSFMISGKQKGLAKISWSQWFWRDGLHPKRS